MVGYEIVDDYQAQYIIGYYWTVVTMNTVGYGDIIPQSDATRLFSVGVMCITAPLFGYAMDSLALNFF